eukprot:Platyproteum_vivax@DN6105_c0_g1_i1.p1
MGTCYLQMPIDAFGLDATVDFHSLSLCSHVVLTYFSQFFAVFTGPFLFWYIYISYFRRLGECCICREECTVLTNLTCQTALMRQKSRQKSILMKIIQAAKNHGYSFESLLPKGSGPLASLWCHLFSDNDEFSFFPRGDEAGMEYFNQWNQSTSHPSEEVPVPTDNIECSPPNEELLQPPDEEALQQPWSLPLCGDMVSTLLMAKAKNVSASISAFIAKLETQKWPLVKLLEELASSDCGHDNVCRECLRRCVERQMDQDLLPPRCPVCRQLLGETDFMHLLEPPEQHLLRRTMRDCVEKGVWQLLRVGWPTHPPSFLLLWSLLSLPLCETLSAPPSSHYNTCLYNHSPITDPTETNTSQSRLTRCRSEDSKEVAMQDTKRRCQSTDSCTVCNGFSDEECVAPKSREGVELMLRRCFGMQGFPLAAIALSRQVVIKYPSLEMENTARHLVWAYSVMHNSNACDTHENKVAVSLVMEGGNSPISAADHLNNEYLRGSVGVET